MSTTTLRRLYVAIVGLTAGAVLAWTLPGLNAETNWPMLLGMAVLTLVAQYAASVVARHGMVFSLSHAIYLATVDLYGVESGVLMALFASISIWLIMTVQKTKNWRGSLEQFVFNSGMSTIHIFVGGWTLIALQTILPDNPFMQIIPWLIAAAVDDQANHWILTGIIYLQNRVDPMKFWRENLWALPVTMVVGTIGGMLLSAAVSALGAQGLLLFFFPLAVSAYSFRMYVRESEKQIEVVRQRTDELEKANKMMRDLAREKDSMLAVLSHDMRTTLGAIDASVQILTDPTIHVTREKARRLLNVIDQSQGTLSSMVSNILKIEQVQNTDQIKPEHTFFNMSDVVESVVGSLEAVATEKHVRLRCYSGNVPAYVEADMQMIQQIVMNLVSNAIKYTPERGSVFVSLEMREDMVLLDVEDTGYGIAGDDLKRIFDPYFRVEAHEKKALGTGLGLSIVKRFVEAHGGRIEVDSVVNQGSRFTVHLPMFGPNGPHTQSAAATRAHQPRRAQLAVS